MTASGSRGAILHELKQALPEAAPLPDLPATGPWQTFADPQQRFATTLQSVGGQFIAVETLMAANSALCEIREWTVAEVRCSCVSGVGDSTISTDTIADPHDLENLDFAVLPGRLGVAENAAVWVTAEDVPHRVLYFIPQHVAIVIPARRIVHNLHEAYDQLEPERTSFGTFISGPSKTADIEQSLVIGAHGARSLTVLAVAEL